MSEKVCPRTPLDIVERLGVQYGCRQAATLRGDAEGIAAADLWLRILANEHWHEIIADLRSLHASPAGERPEPTLDKRVADARAKVASWSQERRDNARLEGAQEQPAQDDALALNVDTLIKRLRSGAGLDTQWDAAKVLAALRDQVAEQRKEIAEWIDSMCAESKP